MTKVLLLVEGNRAEAVVLWFTEEGHVGSEFVDGSRIAAQIDSHADFLYG